MRRSALRPPLTLTDKYHIVGKIGEGTYGVVFKAESYTSYRNSGSSSSSRSLGTPSNSKGYEDDDTQTFAIKVVKSHKEGKNDVVLSSATIREIKLLRELQHDNVVHLHEVYVDPREKTLALIFEYADHNLNDIIKQSRQKPLSEYTRKSLMYQVLKAVDYIHDAWVMHRDLKPDNILVVGHGRNRGQVKLADFGLARVYKDPIKALSDVDRVVVTLWYRAPELLLGAKHYTKAVDLWAVGCIFAEIVNTKELFAGKEVQGSSAPFQKDQLDKIFKVLGMPTPQSWEAIDKLPQYNDLMQMSRERKYPPQSELKNAVKIGGGRSGAALYDLISRMLEYDPETRITAKEALEHEYFKSIEPAPSDWSFDEPGKEPVSFRMQNVEQIAEEALPFSTSRRRDNELEKGTGISSHEGKLRSPSHARGDNGSGQSHSNRRSSSSRNQGSHHSRDSSRSGQGHDTRRDGSSSNMSSNRGGSSGKKSGDQDDQSSGRGGKRHAPDRSSSTNRSRSPKQRRR